MSFWEPCWACRAMRGEIAAGVVTETPDVVVVINPFPLTDGHALVLPRKHVANVYEMPDDLAGPVLAMASRIARGAKLAFAAEGITLRQNNDAASDQHLFHFHLHVVPRFEGDSASFNRVPEWITESEQRAMAGKLSRALSRVV